MDSHGQGQWDPQVHSGLRFSVHTVGFIKNNPKTLIVLSYKTFLRVALSVAFRFACLSESIELLLNGADFQAHLKPIEPEFLSEGLGQCVFQNYLRQWSDAADRDMGTLAQCSSTQVTKSSLQALPPHQWFYLWVDKFIFYFLETVIYTTDCVALFALMMWNIEADMAPSGNNMGRRLSPLGY